MGNIIRIKDMASMHDSIGNDSIIHRRLQAGPKKTHIIAINHDTGEILREGHNAIMLEGSQMAACKMFGLEQTVITPTYNSMLSLDKTLSSDWDTQPYNDPIICLWAAGRDGFDNTANEVNVTSNLDLIRPDSLVPFRYQSVDDDLPQELRDVYFGRKSDKEWIKYYFKAFDTTPLLHIRYLDGTEVTSNLYNVDSSQIAEIWVEMRLSVTRNDFRNYFDKVIGWDNADISTISLLMAWYDNTVPEDSEAAEQDKIFYKWYQDIVPFSKWNFTAINLSDLTYAVDFIYQVYF